MAAGKVCTGFSKPYVAKYGLDNSQQVEYTEGQLLARGVDVSASAETATDNNFYADNITAENANGVFTSGEVTLTVDGLKAAAERLIMGLPAAGSDGFIAYDDDQDVPDVGIGFVVRYMEDGVTSYCPVIFPRVAFQSVGIDAATQEDQISFQTRSLTATIKRSEDAKRTWRLVGADVATEALAEAAIKTYFNIQ